MYDFLYSEVWWMETLINAVVTIIACLVSSFTAIWATKKQNDKRMDNIQRNVGKDGLLDAGHTNLSKEHKDLSKEHNDIKLNIKDVISNQKEIRQNTDKIYLSIEKEFAKSELRYNALTEKDKNVIDNIQALLKNYQELVYENKLLRNEIKNLKQHSNKQSYNTSNHYYEDEDELEM